MKKGKNTGLAVTKIPEIALSSLRGEKKKKKKSVFDARIKENLKEK